MKKLNDPRFILHKYYINANYMRTLFDEYIEKSNKKSTPAFDPQLMGLMSLW